MADAFQELKFRDPQRARALSEAIHREVKAIGRAPIPLMHVCGSHEQAIARFGLRAVLPRELEVIMGPGCPVCITDTPEVDEAVALAAEGKVVCTYGDMLRLPGTSRSLADAQAEGGRVEVVYSVAQAVEIAQRSPEAEVVFFASGFETTAVATAAVVLAGLPRNLTVLSAHKYVPAAMEVVAEMEETNIQGFIAAGHAATITGWGIFEPFAARTRTPVVVAGFEPLDVLAAILKCVELIRAGRAEVANCYPRCVTREGNRPAQEKLWKVFQVADGVWRGIASVPRGNLELRPEWSSVNARRRFHIDVARVGGAEKNLLAEKCLCGLIMSGLRTPRDCELFGKECRPESPVGACMVSSEGACKIWHQYGGLPDLREVGT
ncbi:MAG TPA: hydrogenase formation protein HypD [Anaeromyxobacteraceae bacterium]|nr:hydrogenase formation protein HypD [Anaeromyxobacteraceae bacterium]